jgi:cell division protein DivIC
MVQFFKIGDIMKSVTKKDKRRLIVLICIFVPLLALFLSNMFSYWSSIFTNVKDKKDLEEAYLNILEEEELLKSEILKLQDDEYLARYAREKYLYSKDGELIIKID